MPVVFRVLGYDGHSIIAQPLDHYYTPDGTSVIGEPLCQETVTIPEEDVYFYTTMEGSQEAIWERLWQQEEKKRELDRIAEAFKHRKGRPRAISA